MMKWRADCEVKASIPGGRPRSVALVYPASTPRTPGLYRITVEQDDAFLIYIGESSNLLQRLCAYLYLLHENRPQSTTARLAAEIRAAACAQRRVSIDVATTGKVVAQGEEVRLDMSMKAHRILAETAAVVAESHKHHDDAIILNKVLDDHTWLRDAPSLDEFVPARTVDKRG